jgi:hypothetical protein
MIAKAVPKLIALILLKNIDFFPKSRPEKVAHKSRRRRPRPGAGGPWPSALKIVGFPDIL